MRFGFRLAVAMLPVLITIDTEYSSGLYASGEARERVRNFERTIACRGSGGEAGIPYQLDVFDRHGIKGVFFVDPMPALVWSQEAVDAIVHPILEAGHEVQLHCHTEWLEHAEGNPFGPERGQNIGDFALDTQVAILGYGRERLIEAGAPPPTMFRAGNYGANDDTLRALARLGMTRDSSFAPGYPGSPCSIDLPPGRCEPTMRRGIEEWPIAAIAQRGGWRHGQITALSAGEMIAAITHAAQRDWAAFILVSHSFEFFNRQRGLPNPVLMRRFERLCEWLGQSDLAEGVGTDRLPAIDPQASAPLLPHSMMRTAGRIAEQALANRFSGNAR